LIRCILLIALISPLLITWIPRIIIICSILMMLMIVITLVDILISIPTWTYLIIFHFSILIRKHLICFIDFFKIILFPLIKVRMISLRQVFIALFDCLWTRPFLNVEDFIVVFGGVEGLCGKVEYASHNF
jgi:hypothetical protein